MPVDDHGVGTQWERSDESTFARVRRIKLPGYKVSLAGIVGPVVIGRKTVAVRITEVEFRIRQFWKLAPITHKPLNSKLARSLRSRFRRSAGSAARLGHGGSCHLGENTR